MIDGTREGEMDAGYMLRVDEALAGNVVVDCMRRGDRELKVGFIEQDAPAVAWHEMIAGGGADGAYLISCVGSQH
jgi:hypothetical protein